MLSQLTMPQKCQKNFRKAMRQTVQEDINEWRRNTPWVKGAKCLVTGEVMKKKDSEVDHFPVSFSELVDNWLSLQSKTWEQIPYEFVPSVRRFALRSPVDDLNWYEYHRKHCTLRWVSRIGNRRQGDLGYRKRKRTDSTEKPASSWQPEKSYPRLPGESHKDWMLRILPEMQADGVQPC